MTVQLDQLTLIWMNIIHSSRIFMNLLIKSAYMCCFQLKDMDFDEMLALFQQTLQDVLGGLFKVSLTLMLSICDH